MWLADRFRTTHARIALGYTLLVAASFAILFAVTFWLVTQAMTASLRVQVEAEAADLMLTYETERFNALAADVNDGLVEKGDSAVYLLLDRQAATVAGNVGSIAPFSGWREMKLQPFRTERDDPAAMDSYLVVGRPFDAGFLMVGFSRQDIEGAENILLRSLAWTASLTLILGLAGGVFFGGRLVRRVETISQATYAIMEGDLSRRVPVEGSRDEIDSLAANVNRMLDRIQDLMTNVEQVTNDIAHDLRTPLGRVRQRLEVARRKEQSVAGLGMAIDHAIEDVDGILGIFSALLKIAQVEAGTVARDFVEADLSEIAGRVSEAYALVAEDHRQKLEAQIAPNVVIWGDHGLLAQALANLLENAIKHSGSGTTISVKVLRALGEAQLEVADTGPGIPAADRDLVLRRFVRLETSRTTPGSGLGLSLVKAVVILHGGRIELADNDPGLRVLVSFPMESRAS
ncbi:ATP-binding protein [Hypericibacter sp.]|uniref:sensor histidine kinase n=1 Tax=Hypericibacter sp. TaxID=2705401 RepID=UPI003D6CDA36